MAFLILIAELAAAGIVAILILRLAQNLMLSAWASFWIYVMPEREREGSGFIAPGSVALSGLLFLYAAGAWSALSVAITRAVIIREAVTGWLWLYYGACFVCYVGIVMESLALDNLEQRVAKTRTVWDQSSNTYGFTFMFSLIISGIALAAWIGFAIWPKLMQWPYGWFVARMLH